MSSPLFNSLGGNTIPNNQMTQIINQFNQFKSTLNENPKDIVMNMLQSGKITQQQLNQAQQMANQLKQFLK